MATVWPCVPVSHPGWGKDPPQASKARIRARVRPVENDPEKGNRRGVKEKQVKGCGSVNRPTPGSQRPAEPVATGFSQGVKIQKIRGRFEGLGVKFHFGVEASHPILGFDETVLAVGALEPRVGGFALSNKIQTGLSFLYGLRHQGLKIEKGDRYYVYGGGNVALDALRSIARAGGAATLVYRRSQAEMPGDPKMLSLALEEGAKASFLSCIVSASEDYLSIAPTHLGEAGEDGRRRFEVDESQAAPMPYDHLILCLGQISRHMGEENAIGDAKDGAKDVARAIASGLEFAKKAKRRFT